MCFKQKKNDILFIWYSNNSNQSIEKAMKHVFSMYILMPRPANSGVNTQNTLHANANTHKKHRAKLTRNYLSKNQTPHLHTHKKTHKRKEKDRQTNIMPQHNIAANTFSVLVHRINIYNACIFISNRFDRDQGEISWI